MTSTHAPTAPTAPTAPAADSHTVAVGTVRPSTRAQIRIGWVLTALVVAFLAFDVVGKLTRPAPVVEGT